MCLWGVIVIQYIGQLLLYSLSFFLLYIYPLHTSFYAQKTHLLAPNILLWVYSNVIDASYQKPVCLLFAILSIKHDAIMHHLHLWCITNPGPEHCGAPSRTTRGPCFPVWPPLAACSLILGWHDHHRPLLPRHTSPGIASSPRLSHQRAGRGPGSALLAGTVLPSALR